MPETPTKPKICWYMNFAKENKCNNTNFATKMLVPLCQLSTAKFWQHPKTSDLVAWHPGTLGNLRKTQKRSWSIQSKMFSSQLVTLTMLWQKTPGWSQERLIITDSCHRSRFVIGCHRDLCRAETGQPRKWDVIAVYGFISRALSLSNALDFYRRPLIQGRKQVFLHKSWNALHLHHGVSAPPNASPNASPNVAKFEGRWPKSAHNAGSNLVKGAQ